MVLSLSCRRLHSLIRNSNYRLYSGGYVVLLPEIGPSLPDQPNPLLKDGLPNFEDITPEKCAHTLGKSLLDFEHEVFAVESRLKEAEQETQKDEEYSNGFIQKVVQPLQKPGITLDTTWGIVKTIFIVDEEKLPSSSYFKLHSRAHRAQYSRYSFQQIYKASKDCDLTQLSEEEQRVVERYQLEGHLNGLGLSKDDKESFDNLSKRLYLEKYDFNKRVQLCKGLFNNKISDQYVVKNFPIKLLESMAEDSNEPTIGPWLVPMDNYNYNKFLEYCPDDNLRLQVWKDKNSIASFELDVSELYNSVSLEKIRDIRLQQATLLGYPNFATMSMETKMAGTLENVLNVLELLRTYAFEAHIEEIDKLQEFASSSGFKKTLYIPDIPYWSRKQKKVLFNFENEEVREYFPFPKVVSGLIAFCEKMFGIRIELVENADTWHPDVTFYHVFEGDSVGPVASFFFDPFYRPEKLKCDPEEGWVVNIHPAYQTNGPRSVPLCSLIMNLPPPIYGKPSLLSYSEVQGLFGKVLRLTHAELAKEQEEALNKIQSLGDEMFKITDDHVKEVIHLRNKFTELTCRYDCVKHEAVKWESLVNKIESLTAHKMTEIFEVKYACYVLYSQICEYLNKPLTIAKDDVRGQLMFIEENIILLRDALNAYRRRPEKNKKEARKIV